jgi:hypothetical protein
MHKFRKLWERFVDVLDDFLAYVLTILGILVSTYVPLLKSSGIIDVHVDWWRVGISAIVALVIIGKQESLDVDDTGSSAKSRAGRKRKFTIRMANALAQGIAWSQIMEMAK